MKSRNHLSVWDESALGKPPAPEVYRAFRDTGCQIARKRIVEGILPMITMIATKHERWAMKVGPLRRDDLIQEGMFGALNAARLFDPEMGIKFTTYSFKAIQNYIVRAIQSSDFVSKGARNEGNQSKIYSYDRKTSRNMDKPVVDLFESKREPERSPYSMQEMLSMIHDDREREVIRLRFCEDMTLQEVGDVFGITRERIRQLEMRALESIRLGVTLNARHPARRLTEAESRRDS